MDLLNDKKDNTTTWIIIGIIAAVALYLFFAYPSSEESDIDTNTQTGNLPSGLTELKKISYPVKTGTITGTLQVKYDLYDLTEQGEGLFGYCITNNGGYKNVFSDTTNQNVEENTYTIPSDCLKTTNLDLRLYKNNEITGGEVKVFEHTITLQ